MQLVELQRILPALAAHDIALFALSYDSVETLSSFSRQNSITFPLLSDHDSQVIRAVGMLDERLDEHHAAFGLGVQEHQRGVAYPGVFQLDNRGIVVEKRFGSTYRVRESGSILLAEALGLTAADHGPERTTDHDRVRVQVRLDSPSYFRYQSFRLVTEVIIAPGFHVYGTPVPDGYVPLTLRIEASPGLDIEETRWPKPHPLTVEGLDEEFSGYNGTIEGSTHLAFNVAADAGDQVLRATVDYQVCSAMECFPPSSDTFSLPLTQRPDVVS